MDLPTPVLFELPTEPADSSSRISELLSRRTSLALADETKVGASGSSRGRGSRTYLDTFDGRLHRAGRVLTFLPGRRGGRLELETLDGEPVRRARAERRPTFADDLPAGPLALEVAPEIEMRRLLPLAELENPGPELRVVDDLEKTVVRLEVLAGTVAPGDGPWLWGDPPPDPAPLPPLLLVRPVRGYDRAFEEVVQGLDGLARSEPDLLTRVLSVLGRHPRDYSSKLRLQLDPDTPAEEATREIHRTLWATVRANAEGTRRDLDPEFLHDFRVAVRRTRSVLSQVKAVFPEGDVSRFKKEFRWLGRATGPTRDLDVYLLKLPDYRAELGDRVQRHLDPLRTFLEEHQQIEQAKLAKVLRSRRYRKLVRDWEAFLTPPETQDQPTGEEMTEGTETGPGNARLPIRRIARRRIWKTWKRVRKRGSAIDAESPAADLHRLRIDCKKLRYLLELFGSLFPSEEIRPPVRALKKLQDNLGDFNDYQVQQHRLESFADQMVDEDLAPVPTLLAMGRLLAHLDRGQERERRRFEKRFQRFTSKKQRRRFESLFQPDATETGPRGGS